MQEIRKSVEIKCAEAVIPVVAAVAGGIAAGVAGAVSAKVINGKK